MHAARSVQDQLIYSVLVYDVATAYFQNTFAQAAHSGDSRIHSFICTSFGYEVLHLARNVSLLKPPELRLLILMNLKVRVIYFHSFCFAIPSTLMEHFFDWRMAHQPEIGVYCVLVCHYNRNISNLCPLHSSQCVLQHAVAIVSLYFKRMVLYIGECHNSSSQARDIITLKPSTPKPKT